MVRLILISVPTKHISPFRFVTMKSIYFPSFFFTMFLFNIPALLGNTGGVSGSNLFQVTSDGTSTTFKIVSASITGEPIFTGSVSSVSDTNITFSTSIDENNETVYPFFAAGSFNKDVQVPRITSPSISSGSVPNSFSSSNIDYGGGFDSNLVGFTNAPEVVISPSDGGGENALATVTLGTGLNSGKITSISVTDGGTSYSSTPSVSIVGGPHFVRIIDSESNYFGRVFLIENNSQTSLKLDFSSATVVNGETQAASTYFASGTLVEICPAATLSSIFGSGSNLLSGMSSASTWDSPDGADWIYLYSAGSGYIKYFHVDYSGHRFLSSKTGWYSQGSSTLSNNAVIYPDEAFIIAKRKNGTIELDVEVSQLDAPARIYLPESGDIFVANNPYGMDMLLAELIPSTSVGTGTTEFKPKLSSDSDYTNADTITILNNSGWSTYYYTDGDNDGGITEMMKASARSGSGGSNALLATDLFIDSGTVTNIQSCSDAAGSNTVTNYNDGNYSKITISGSAQSNITGFKVTLNDLQGYMLSEDGANEVNATTGDSVDTNGSGSIVYSNLNGTHEIVGSGSGFLVIEKQRDVNFKSDEGSRVWNVGDLGTGYDGNAQWFAIGGGGTGAKGTVTTGGSFTVTAGGSGYTSAPQIIVSGGGWRNITGGSSPQGGQVIGSDDGIIIHRKHTSGVTAFIELANIAD
jgi:hypothetical protein